MTDDGETEAPRGPLFVALDLYDRIPRIRTACAALGVPLASVDLKDGPRAEIGFGTTAGKHGEHDHRGHASIEVVAGYEVRLSIEATHRLDRPAPLGSVIAQLRASVAALDILLEPPGEVVDAEFTELPDQTPNGSECAAGTGARVPADDADRAFILAGNVSRYLQIAEAVAAGGVTANEAKLEELLGDIGELAGEVGLAERLRGLGDRIAGPFWRDREKTLETMHKAAEAEVDKLRARAQKAEGAFGHLAFVAAALGVTTGEDPSAAEIGRLAKAQVELLQSSLQGAREGRDAAWFALHDLAKRAGVVLQGTESAAEIADHIFAASARGREQRDIDDLLGRLGEVRKALGLDEDCYHGAVMERLGLLKSLADAVMAELEMVDLEGVEQMAVACLSGGRDNRRQYLELAAAIGCGANPAHDTAIRKAEQLQLDAKVASDLRVKADRHDTLVRELGCAGQPERAFNAVEILKNKAGSAESLNRLRMALFLSMNASPAEIVDAALSRIEAGGAAVRKAEALLDSLSKMKARLSAAVSSFEEVGRQLRSLDVPALAEQQAREGVGVAK
jgi:hypothetical protein